MTNGEIQAILIANKYHGNVSEIKKLKKLGEEFTEFIEAVLVKGENEMIEEAGDMCYLILHILSSRINHDEINLIKFVMMASDKLEMRARNNTLKSF